MATAYKKNKKLGKATEFTATGKDTILCFYIKGKDIPKSIFYAGKKMKRSNDGRFCYLELKDK